MSKFGFMMRVGAAQSRLQLLSDTVVDTQEANARAAAQTIVNDIKRRAPVDTGRLRRSYGYEIDRKGSETTVTIGSDVEYAEYQEFGTSRMPAQPHVRPALEANREQAIQLLGGEAVEDAKNSI